CWRLSFHQLICAPLLALLAQMAGWDTEGNATISPRGKGAGPTAREPCSAPGASLAGVDSEQEMAFLLCHKGVYDHWIGLRREQGQPWTCANGTKFKDL
ncbi:unnamed protein product, partial [Eretmochelys imbricata]